MSAHASKPIAAPGRSLCPSSEPPRLPDDATMLDRLLWARELADWYRELSRTYAAKLRQFLEAMDDFPEFRQRWLQIVERDEAIDALVERVNEMAG